MLTVMGPMLPENDWSGANNGVGVAGGQWKCQMMASNSWIAREWVPHRRHCIPGLRCKDGGENLQQQLGRGWL